MTDYNYIEIPRMNMKSSTFAEFVKRIKELEEENKRLKENIHSMLFTDGVVQDRYDKAKKENEQLKEQLKIAIEVLKCYGQENWAYADEYTYIPWNEYTGGWCHAEKALERIGELDK